MNAIIWDKVENDLYEGYYKGTMVRWVWIVAHGRALVFQAPGAFPKLNPTQWCGKYYSLQDAWDAVENDPGIERYWKLFHENTSN